MSLLQVNEYQVLEPLGSGSFGSAYLVSRVVGDARGEGEGDVSSSSGPPRKFAMKVFKRAKLRSSKELVRRGNDTVRRARSTIP